MTTTLAAPDAHHQTRTSAVRGEASLAFLGSPIIDVDLEF